jgi:hypothetical protein
MNCCATSGCPAAQRERTPSHPTRRADPARGAVVVALVSRFILGEQLGGRHLAGLAFLAVGMVRMLRRS